MRTGFKITFLLILVSIYGCCPKITESVSTVHTVDTVSVFIPVHDTVNLPTIADTFTINFDQICDSINRGSHPVLNFEHKNSNHTARIQINTASGSIICREDSLIWVIDSLREVKITDTTLTKQTTVVHEKYVPLVYKIIAGIAAVLFLLLLILIRDK